MHLRRPLHALVTFSMLLAAALSAGACDVAQDVGESRAEDAGRDAADEVHDADTDLGSTSDIECSNLLVDADGCDANSVCVNEGSGGSEQRLRCRSFPPCPAEGECAIGAMGATCGDAIYSTKTPMCIPSMCRDEANCPTDWRCIHSASFSTAGFCSSGGFYMPCATSDDCIDSLSCHPTGTGLPGLCF